MSALIRQKELELKHATQEYEVQLRLLQEELGSKAKKKDNQVLQQFVAPVFHDRIDESQ